MNTATIYAKIGIEIPYYQVIIIERGRFKVDAPSDQNMTVKKTFIYL